MSALVEGGRGRRGGEARRLVVDRGCEFLKLGLVLVGVVGAEEQLSPDGSVARTYAWAPHRSHRSVATSGRSVIVAIIWRPLPHIPSTVQLLHLRVETLPN
jgi:hypothetical protein